MPTIPAARKQRLQNQWFKASPGFMAPPSQQNRTKTKTKEQNPMFGFKVITLQAPS